MDPHGYGHELQQKSTPRGAKNFKSRDDDFQRVPHISSGASHSSLLQYDSDAQKTGRPGPQVTATDLESIPKIASWKIHWRSPALMAGFFLAGVWFALGHHFHYQALEDQEVGSAKKQQWAIRIGTLLAFLSKACLAGAVGVAYTQRLWVTVKEKPISIRNLDNVFSLTTSPVSFFSLEVLTSAKILCLLAACMWCIPIAATITPATLSVRTVMLPNSTTARVPLPEFLNEDAWANFEGVGRPSSSTASVNRILAAASSSMSTLSFAAPFTNSSYTVDFYGPSMRCEDLSTASADSLDLGEAKSLQEAFEKTLNISELSPGLSVLYAAGSPDSVEGVMMHNHLFVYVPNSDTQNLSCHLWNTSYQVLFRFDDGVQSTIIQNLTHIAPTDIQGDEIMTEYAPGEIAYWSMFSALSRILTTTLGFGSTMYLNGADSTFIQTGVAACPQISNVSGYSLAQYSSPWMCRNGSVDRAIEDLSHNFTLSLLSTDLFSNMTDAPITVVSSKVHYEYNHTDLLIAYAAAVGVALVCIGVGASAYFANGYSASTSFSSIMSTTRNADLDRLARGACLGAQPLPQRMGDMKLRFGILQSEDSVPHAAFGLQEHVAKLQKGDVCS